MARFDLVAQSMGLGYKRAAIVIFYREDTLTGLSVIVTRSNIFNTFLNLDTKTFNIVGNGLMYHFGDVVSRISIFNADSQRESFSIPLAHWGAWYRTTGFGAKGLSSSISAPSLGSCYTSGCCCISTST